jgi:uncharacterized Zn finger protein (UPF0148 family)
MVIVSRCPDCGAPLSRFAGETYCPECDAYEPAPDPAARVLIADMVFTGPDPTAELALRDVVRLYEEGGPATADELARRMAALATAALRRIDAARGPSQARPSEGA